MLSQMTSIFIVALTFSNPMRLCQCSRHTGVNKPERSTHGKDYSGPEKIP
jgi:hypothetical protein